MMTILNSLNENADVKILTLDRLDQPFRSMLQSLHRGDPQIGLDGLRHEIHAVEGVNEQLGMWMYDLCRKIRPKATLEVGMAYGFSMLYILAAAEDHTSHTAIDFLQLTQYHGIAVYNATKSGSDVELFTEHSFKALAKLAQAARRFEMIFIDGGHRFDEVITDFSLCAEVCPLGGFIVLDDNWMPSVATAVAFIKNNRRDFECISTPISRIVAFRKVGEDQRAWNHFEPFRVVGHGNRFRPFWNFRP
jgi:predicted O-methyltransferase YrrM